MISLLLACSSPQPELEEASAPAVAVEQEPVFEQRFVHASKLNLRDQAGEKIGSLTINTPLVLQGEEGDRVQVRVANGTVGWVPKEFLGAGPLTADQALEEASTAPDLETKISALQRAAALKPSVETLTALAEAYEESGEGRKAGVVRSQMGWPQHLRPINRTFGNVEIAVEWPIGWDGDIEQNQQRVRRSMKLNKGDTVWVLSNIGPAVQGTVREISLHPTNDCSGEEAWVAVLDVTLPTGAVPALMSTESPPESWMQTRPTPTVSYETAMEKMLATVQEIDPNAEALNWEQLWPEDEVWRGEYSEYLEEEVGPEMDIFNPVHRHYVLLMDAAGQVTIASKDLHEYDAHELRALLTGDLAGTGVDVQVVGDSCQSAVRTVDGYSLLSSTYRCCGC